MSQKLTKGWRWAREEASTKPLTAPKCCGWEEHCVLNSCLSAGLSVLYGSLVVSHYERYLASAVNGHGVLGPRKAIHMSKHNWGASGLNCCFLNKAELSNLLQAAYLGVEVILKGRNCHVLECVIGVFCLVHWSILLYIALKVNPSSLSLPECWTILFCLLMLHSCPVVPGMDGCTPICFLPWPTVTL